MMQDAPQRALNKVFARLKDNCNTDREHVELIFNLQQTVLDGLEYLEVRKRELSIRGIPSLTTIKSVSTLSTPHQQTFAV